MISRRYAAVLSAVAAVGVGALTGCSGGAQSAPSSPATPTSSTSSVVPSTPAPVSSTAPTSVTPSTPASSGALSVASSSSAAPSTPAPTSSSAQAQPKSTCSSLMLRVLIGSGDNGREFAALQFMNTGSSACTLYGYPTVTLSLNGKRLGGRSKPGGTATSARRLGPGDTAESPLTDYVANCNAPLSDTVHLVAPGSSISTSRPGQLRNCPLRVGPLGPPE